MTDRPEASGEAAELTEFAMALYEFVERLRGEYERTAAEAGLTAGQATILAFLSSPLPMRGLADRMGCDPSNITGMVDRLEEKGLVERTADPSDRRVKRVAATPAGRSASAGFQDELVRVSSLARLDADARRTLLAVLSDASTDR